MWRRLEDLCRRLEALAHKQLRGVRFSKEEQHFLIGFGEQLAGIMLYGGNSYLTPRDDAPRIVDVYYNPNDKRSLEVGIARARALYVLYPVLGGEILCRGSVMPYYEFTHTRPAAPVRPRCASLAELPQFDMLHRRGPGKLSTNRVIQRLSLPAIGTSRFSCASTGTRHFSPPAC